MRRALAGILCSALLLSLQQAQLLHLHEKSQASEHVASHHPHGVAAHTHLSDRHEPPREQDHAEIEAADELASAIAIFLFHSESAQSPIQYPVTLAVAAALDYTVSSLRASQERPRIHDPPFTVSLIPRAPPV